jgi:hypothetical protein
MTTLLRWCAGPGAPGLVLDALRAAGWTVQPDEVGNADCTSPDLTLRVAFGPESPAYHRGGPLWTVTYTPTAPLHPEACDDCGTGHPALPWTATFGDHTPAEAIAALLADLTGPGRLDFHRADRYQA